MDSNNQPLVSIGLPVYNGENFIKTAIDSILNQSYKTLELIISDNASTDMTQKICESYSSQDPRIKYIRFDENQGAAKNFNNTHDLSKGKYFKWASHDDYLENTYIEKCVEVLEKDDEVHLCHSRKNIVNKHDDIKAKDDFVQIDLNQARAFKRFLSFLNKFRYYQDDADVVFGLFRSEILFNTQRIASYHSSDFTLVAEIILQGKIFIIKDYLFYRRFHEQMSTIANHTKAKRAKWFNTKKGSSNFISYFPFLLWFLEFIKFIRKSNLKFSDKLILSLASIKWLILRVYYRVVVKLKIKRSSDFGQVFVDIN